MKAMLKKIGKENKLVHSQELLILLTVIGLSIFMSIASSQFLSVNNLINVTRQISITGIMAVGMTFVILTSGIDLSVGSTMALTGTIVAGLMANNGLHPVLAVLGGILLGAIVGSINGILVAYSKIPAIIVTLAMMEIARGAALLYTGGHPLTGLPDSFAYVGREYVFGWIPIPVIIMLLVYLIAHVVLNHLPMGRYIYAIGGNEEAVRLSGIKVKRFKVLAYSISGITASISAIILTSRLMSGQPNSGVGFELDAIAAVVLGGTSIAGGRGKIIGTLLGALLIGILSNGLNLMGVSPFVQRVLKGVIIIVAIYYSSSKRID